MSVRIGFLLDLRAGAALSSLDAQPLVFGSWTSSSLRGNYRLRISAFAPSAASGTVVLEVTHGVAGVAVLASPGVAFTTAAGFNPISLLYDILAGFVGVTATDGAGQVVTVTDAGFDAAGPFVDVSVVANGAPTGPALAVDSGPATITAALDATAIRGYSGRTATALTLAAGVRLFNSYDRNGNLLGFDFEAHLAPTGNLVAATSTANVIDPAAAQRVPQYLLRPRSVELAVIRGANGGFQYGTPADIAPATVIP